MELVTETEPGFRLEYEARLIEVVTPGHGRHDRGQVAIVYVGCESYAAPTYGDIDHDPASVRVLGQCGCGEYLYGDRDFDTRLIRDITK